VAGLPKLSNAQKETAHFFALKKWVFFVEFEIIFVLVMLALFIMRAGIAWGVTGQGADKTGDTDIFLNTESTLTSLKNLSWLRYLTSSKVDIPDRKSVFPSFKIDSTAITSKIETAYAVIYGYQGAEIPSYLSANFDRIFKMVANYLNLETKKNKVVLWMMDFNALQEIYPGQKGYPGGSPNTVAALYAPHFNYFFFTPRYIKDYYVAHELVHHFIDEYQEEVITGLPQVIMQKNMSNLPLENFIKQHEEKIAMELPQIIIRKNLASFALKGV